ncbi:Lectin precursor, partial [Aphelenchoides avenae]
WTDGEFTQPDAQSECLKLGGKLATVDSAAATQCLLDYAGTSSQEATSAWIGLADKEENSKHTANCTCWKWLDGSPFTYENFAPGQPNNAEAKEWCAEIFLPASDYPAGTWNRGVQKTCGVLGTGCTNAVDHERYNDYGSALRSASANRRTFTCVWFAGFA